MLKETKMRYVGHLASIFFNLSVVAIFAVAAIAFSPILYLTVFAVLSIIAIYLTLFSVGTIWTVESFRNFMSSSFKTLFDENKLQLMDKIVSYIPYIAIGAGVTIFLALITLSIDRKRSSSKKKLVGLVIIAIMFVLFMIYVFSQNVFGLGA